MAGMRRAIGRPRLWAIAAVGFAAGASVMFVVVPSYEGECIGIADYGPGYVHCPHGVSHTTLLEENGPHVLWLLAIPVALTLLGLAIPRRRPRIALTVVLGAFTILTGFSIGGAYLPATLAMVLAARRTPTDRAATDHPARS